MAVLKRKGCACIVQVGARGEIIKVGVCSYHALTPGRRRGAEKWAKAEAGKVGPR